MRIDIPLAVLLCVSLLLPPPGLAQQQQPSSGAAAQLIAPGGTLKIVVLQGEGAKNSIRSKSATAPEVEVRDEADKPVAGAEVVFQLPATGPGGVFHGWMRTQTARTNAEGKAAASGFTPNDEEGRFNIKVTANQGSKSGSVVIAQSNIRGGAAAGSSSRSWWKPVLLVVGAGVLAGGIYAGTRGDDSAAAATPASPVVITPGAISVGGPR